MIIFSFARKKYKERRAAKGSVAGRIGIKADVMNLMPDVYICTNSYQNI